MGDYGDLALAHRPRSRWPVLLAVVALAVGVGLGYLLGTATTEPAPLATAPAPTGAPPAPAPAPPPGTPSPCVAIAQGGTDVLAQLDRAARAIGALDPGALREVLDEIRRLRDQLQRDVDACQAQLGGAAPGG